MAADKGRVLVPPPIECLVQLADNLGFRAADIGDQGGRGASVSDLQHASDDLGGFELTDEGLIRREALVIDTCVGRGIPVAAVVGGAGAPHEGTGDCHRGDISGDDDGDIKHVRRRTGAMPMV